VQSPDRIGALADAGRSREKELLRMLQEATEADAEQAGLQTPTHLPAETSARQYQPTPCWWNTFGFATGYWCACWERNAGNSAGGRWKQSRRFFFDYFNSSFQNSS